MNRPVQFKVWHLLVLSLLLVLFVSTACFESQTSSSTENATTAGGKWGTTPKITNFYEYQQMMELYELRDNPKLILNAYIYNEYTGQLTCLGKVQGFGVPYGTEFSQPIGSGNQGSIPEPNGLYPSQNTNADWIRIIDKDGKSHITFAEPNMIITDLDLPCTPLHGTQNGD